MASGVSVVIINYQGRRWLPRCLASVARLDGPVVERVVLDNASRDGSAELVARAFPDVRVVRNRRNVGFARACNQAMRITEGEYVAILNNDLELDPRWLTAVLAVAQERPHAAAVACKLRREGARGLLAGAGVCMNWQGFGYDRGDYEWDTGQYDIARPVFGACGAAMLIRRSAFEAIGPFDERFFMYHEDVDWCWRAWLRGFDIWYAPRAVAYHKGEASSRRYLRGNAKFRLGQRHRIRSLLKCYEGPSLRRSWPRLLTSEPRALAAWLALAPALLWNLWHLPSTLAERRRIQRSRRRRDEELTELIWPAAVPPVPPRRDGPAILRSSRCPCVCVGDVGTNDAAVLGCGWYAPEPSPEDPHLLIRWSQQRASVQLWQPAGARRLRLQLYSLAESIRCPVSGQLLVNARPVGSFASVEDGWFYLEFMIEAEQTGRWITVTLDLRHAWQPSTVFGNRDCRQLGVALRRIGVSAPAAATPASVQELPGVSVIIPTHNRGAVVERTLTSLLQQTYPAEGVELVVVDDGSTDDTASRVDALQRRVGGRLRYVAQRARGAAAARNQGLRLARHRLVLLLDDDVVPELTLIAEHVSAHRQLGFQGDVAVVGYTRWPVAQEPSAFLDYIGEWGPQFGYRFMAEHPDRSFSCFYSSNLSVPRIACGSPLFFDEAFPAVWDDIELGYRLMQRGLRLYYHPRAIGYHHHVKTPKAFEARQQLAGHYAVLFAHRHPELTSWLRASRRRDRSVRRSWVETVRDVVRTRPTSPDVSLRVRWYQWRLHQAYQRGIRDGWRQFGRDGWPPPPVDPVDRWHPLEPADGVLAASPTVGDS